MIKVYGYSRNVSNLIKITKYGKYPTFDRIMIVS